MYLYGAGGHAKVIIEILEFLNIKVEGLYDDNPDIKEIMGYRVLGSLDDNIILDVPLIVTIGNNYTRKKVVLKYPGCFGNATHPSSVISNRVKIGSGTVVMGNVVVNSGTTIGSHVILNTACSIDHDCYISDFSHISPHTCLNGGVSVGEGSHIGSGAVVIPNIKIGKWCVIGAGSVIIRDVPDNSTVVGNPGRIIKKKSIKH